MIILKDVGSVDDENFGICPFCKYEHFNDLQEYVNDEEFTCEECGSLMALNVREITEFTTEPLVDKRKPKEGDK